MEKQLVVYHCGGSAALRPAAEPISCPEEREHFLHRLHALNKVPHVRDNTPLTVPVSIARSELGRLREEPYLVGLKSDGVRYLLLMTMYEGEGRAVMVDRAQQIYDVEVWGNADYFEKETLLDGELLWERSEGGNLQLLYLVFDAVQVCGVHAAALPFTHRLQLISRALLVDVAGMNVEQLAADENRIVAMNNDSGLRFAPKRFVPYEQGLSLWKTRSSCAHMNDGLVFVPEAPGRKVGTDRAQFKWKEDHSVDVVYADGAVLLRTGEGVVPVSELRYGRGAVRIELQKNELVKEGVVLECTCLLRRGRVLLSPIKARPDRAAPNHVKTVVATLQNVEEAVRAEELFL